MYFSGGEAGSQAGGRQRVGGRVGGRASGRPETGPPPGRYHNIQYNLIPNRSEGFALTGYDIPGCVEDGTWMLWGNSSIAAVAVVVVVAHPDFGKLQLLEFYYGIGASGVRGLIRLVFRVPLEPELRKVVEK